MSLYRVKILVSALSFAVALLSGPAANASECASFLAQAIHSAKSVLRLGDKTPADNTEDYLPEPYSRLTLSERYIQTYKRIQNRGHYSPRHVFFYDYEVRDVLSKMSTILEDARDFSKPQTTLEKRYAESYLQLKKKIAQFGSQQRISYLDFHETTLLFAAFQKKGLKSTPSFKMPPRGRYSPSGHKFTLEAVRYRINRSGFEDFDYESDWQQIRSQMLNKAPKAIFIPTFEILDEDFFNAISSYPVFPAGMTTNPNIINDGQLFGPVMLLLHDFYHARRSLSSIDYSAAAIAAREKRRLAFNEAVARVEDPILNHTIRVVFHFVTHEEHIKGPGHFIVLSRSKAIPLALATDVPGVEGNNNMFGEINTRIYDRPFDFGEIFGDSPPPPEVLFAARRWVSDFFSADLYYQ